MKALMLNSGIGKRMGQLTKKHPKCMVELTEGVTIFSLQVKNLLSVNITDIIVTTGPFEDKLIGHATKLFPHVNFTFINNKQYQDTNYIYSIYLAREYVKDDIVLLHGDLVFDASILQGLFETTESCIVTSSSLPLPSQDFKAVVDQKGRVKKVGVEFFGGNTYAAQPLYKLNKSDWLCWLEEISKFCEAGEKQCYAENALNQILDRLTLLAFDVKENLCGEIDNPNDLEKIKRRITYLERV